MAPTSEAMYFPALDKCLNGEQPVIPWQTAYTILRDPAATANGHTLEHFLRNDETQSILKDAFSAFGPASPTSKSDFETKTAPSNVVPPSDGQYDIEQLKGDAQWLSKEARIDEVSALRVTVVEWQERAAKQLCTQWSSEELSSLRGATSGAGYGAMSAMKIQSDNAPRSASDSGTTESDDERHKRILATAHLERDALLKVTELLVGSAQSLDLQPPELGQGNERTATLTKSRSWTYECGKHIWEAQRSTSNASDGFFRSCVTALKDRLDTAADTSKWPATVSSDARTTSVFTKSLLGEIISILRLALLHAQASRELAGGDEVIAWYELMDQHMFFAEIAAVDPDANDQVIIIHCLVSLVSTSLLKVSKALEYVQTNGAGGDDVSYPQLPQKPYLDSEESVRLLTGTLLGATSQSIRHAGPAILAWSLIAQKLREAANAGQAETPTQIEDGSNDDQSPLPRRSSFRASVARQSRPEILLDAIMDTVPGEDPITLMGNGAVNELRVLDTISTLTDAMLHAFSSPTDLHTAICGRLVLFLLVRETVPITTYGPDILQAVLALTSYETDSLNSTPGSQVWPSEPAKRLLDDRGIMGPRFMEQVIARYPYELSPFLACLSTIGKSVASLDEDGSRITQLLDSMPSLTTVLPPNFDAYELVREEEMSNCIQLSEPLKLFAPARSQQTRLLMDRREASATAAPNAEQTIPAGTVGIVLNDVRPFVVCWQYQHSGLEYLGTLLSTRTDSTSVLATHTGSRLDIESAAEILCLISSLLEVSNSTSDVEDSKQLLGRLSNGLTRKDDIIRVVLEIFDEETQQQANRPGAEGSIYLLSQCVRFLRVILKVYPERIWSFLGRSKLLAINETSSAFAAIVGATEVPLAQYPFLCGCVALFEELVEDALKRSVARNSSVTRAVTRFEQPASPSGSAPEKLISSVLSAFETTMIDVFQSQANWRFSNPSERLIINTSIVRVLNKVLQYSFGVDDTTSSRKHLTAALQPAAQIIIELFLAENSQRLSLQPIIDIFLASVAELDVTTETSSAQLIISQTVTALSLCTTLLKVGMSQGQQAKRLMSSLYEAMPLLARLYAVHPLIRGPTAEMLTALVQSANVDTQEPPSLLGHLAPEATKAFLAVVSRLDMPLNSLDTEVKIWDLLSAVVSNKQQWLAICLLTGSTPREMLKVKDSDMGSQKANPLLTYALNQLSHIGSLAPRRAIAMLAFVSHSQNHWSWATNDIGGHDHFISAVTDWLAELTGHTKPSDTEAATRTANENQMAAFIADILATYLHSARQSGQTSTAKNIVPKLAFLRGHGVAVNGYNHSLHKNLAKNFGQKFPHLSLIRFKRTSLLSMDFGRSYYYDLELAGKMLDFEPSWSRGNGQGFADEIARANVNISVVESQIALLKSWKSLAIELCGFAKDDVHLQQDLAKVVGSCLKASMETSVPTLLFENVQETRAEFAFVLLQRLTSMQSKEKEVRDLVHPAWDAVRTYGQDFEVISTSRDAAYYRTLLQILFLTLQPQTYNPPGDATSQRKSVAAGTKTSAVESPLTATLLEILQKVVANNFRALCSAVHSAPADPSNATIVSTTDFVLVTALLQTVLRILTTHTAQQQIASIVADSSLVRYSTSLYSWSDSLSPGPDDPIYAELSILFLLSLSSVPLVAEQTAVAGILSHLSAANISQYLRQPPHGKGPFDSPARMHAVWTRGLLPLCLNLLEHVGPGIAAEVAGFLNSFPAQLRRLESDLSTSPAQPSPRSPHAGSITLCLAAEAHSLALLAAVIERLKLAGPAVGVVASEIQSIGIERVALRDAVEGCLRSRRALRERIVPLGEREVAWARRKVGESGAESVLEERVVAELQGALECLSA